MSELQISPNLSLPDEAVTQTFVIFGKRGSGKSNAGVVLAEEMARIMARWVALDPVGHWWGLKAKGDGSPGLEVLVFGGPHADLPLEPTAGALMADLVLDYEVRVVLCTVEFNRSETARFVTDFCERLLKRELIERIPLHVFIEEADKYAPQKPFPDEARMLAAVDNMERRGRQGGLGTTLITQRSARINKDLTTQAEVLIAFRTLGPQDRDAIDDWIKYHEAGARRTELLESLSKLGDGESWIWSPEWLEFFGRVRWRRRETFDAAETPKLGQKVVKPHLAKVDLEALRGRMASTIERAKQDDPKELRKEIQRLRRQLESKRVPSEPVVERVEVPVLSDEARAQLENLIGQLTDVGADISRSLRLAAPKPSGPLRPVRQREGLVSQILTNPLPRPIRAERITGNPIAPTTSVRVELNGSITAPQQRILDTLGWLASVRLSPANRAQVAFLSGYSPNGGAYNNYLGALRTKGLIEYPTGGRVELTAAGREMADIPLDPPSTTALQHRIFDQLGAPKTRILKALIATYPDPMTREDLGQATDYEANGGAFNNYLGALRSLGLVEYPLRGMVVAQPVLFLGEAA